METKKKGAKESEKRKEIQKLEKTILKNWESLKDYRNRSDKVSEGARGVGNIENFNDNLVCGRPNEKKRDELEQRRDRKPVWGV